MRLRTEWFLRISFHEDLGVGAVWHRRIKIGWTLSRPLPPPLVGVGSPVRPTRERLTPAVTWGVDMRADEIRPSIGDSLRGARRV